MANSLLFDRNNSEIEFFFDDSKKGELLVFVPGSFSTSSAWKPIIKNLKKNYTIVSTSLRGYGATNETRTMYNYSIEHQIEIIRTIAKKISKPFHLIGHSFGGLVTIVSVLKFEFQIKSFITFEANPIWFISNNHNIFFKTQMTAKFFKNSIENNADNSAKIIIDFYGGRNTFNNFPKSVQNYCNKTAKTNLLDWMMAINNDFPQFNYEKLHDKLRSIPAFFIIGEYANELVKSINIELIKTFKNGKSKTIPKANHFLISTHAKDCAEAIDEFIKS